MRHSVRSGKRSRADALQPEVPRGDTPPPRGYATGSARAASTMAFKVALGRIALDAFSGPGW